MITVYVMYGGHDVMMMIMMTTEQVLIDVVGGLQKTIRVVFSQASGAFGEN